jgi:hypothetical protein
MCVCSLSYAACKAHAPCYNVICGLSGSTIIFPLYLIKGTIFGKEVTEYKVCVLCTGASNIHLAPVRNTA